MNPLTLLIIIAAISRTTTLEPHPYLRYWVAAAGHLAGRSMIVHEVKIGKKSASQITKREHRKIYVGCAESDIRYRDMLVNFRHRWEFYTKSTIDFLTFDWNKSELDQQKQAAKKTFIWALCIKNDLD